jgi:hypothetical protein
MLRTVCCLNFIVSVCDNLIHVRCFLSGSTLLDGQPSCSIVVKGFPEVVCVGTKCTVRVLCCCMAFVTCTTLNVVYVCVCVVPLEIIFAGFVCFHFLHIGRRSCNERCSSCYYSHKIVNTDYTKTHSMGDISYVTHEGEMVRQQEILADKRRLKIPFG